MEQVSRGEILYILTGTAIEVCHDGYTIGALPYDLDDWDKIEAGADPIADGWEDGCGNPLTLDGWGPKNERGKILFELMLQDWLADHSPDLDDLEIREIYWDGRDEKWKAEAVDAEGRGYTLIDDGAGNIEIG